MLEFWLIFLRDIATTRWKFVQSHLPSSFWLPADRTGRGETDFKTTKKKSIEVGSGGRQMHVSVHGAATTLQAAVCSCVSALFYSAMLMRRQHNARMPASSSCPLHGDTDDTLNQAGQALSPGGSPQVLRQIFSWGSLPMVRMTRSTR